MKRIAVLGGTFDPVHRGHIAIAEQVADAVDAEQAWLIPAGTPPHRTSPAAPAEQRLAMAQAAVRGRNRLQVLDLELRREGASYTVDTLAELGRGHPGVEFWFIVGADVAGSVRTWHRATELLEVARFAVVNRTGTPAFDDHDLRRWGFDKSRTRAIYLDSPPIRSRDVRRRVAAGRPVGDLVPMPVGRLITELDLYRLR